MAKIKKAFVTWEELVRYVTGGIGEGGDSSYYTKTEIDDFFEGEASGKKQVHWDRVTNKPSTFTPSAHTHVKADITDTPWAWADVSKTGSNLTDLATRQHAGLTDITSDQHHAQSHVLSGSDHTASGLTIGYVIRASGASSFVWARLQHADLGGVTKDLHHNKDHATRHQSGGADDIKLDDLATPDDNIDLNVSISRHGLFPKLSNEAAECYSGIGQWLRLYDSTSIIIGILSGASANLRNSNDTERTTSLGSYTKLKETKMGEPTGVMNIYFTLESVGGETVYGRIYKNGVAIGTARSTTTVSNFNEDLGGFDSQDLIQIYAYAELEDTVKVRNMRFRYDRSITMLGECTLTTPIAITTQNPFSMQNQDP